MSAPKIKSPSGVYLIQDARQYVGNAVLWWCPNGAGYTGRDTDVGIPIEAAMAGRRTICDGGRMHGALASMQEKVPQ